jgi:hypothetical protein
MVKTSQTLRPVAANLFLRLRSVQKFAKVCEVTAAVNGVREEWSEHHMVRNVHIEGHNR